MFSQSLRHSRQVFGVLNKLRPSAPTGSVQVRSLNIHEKDAFAVMKSHGVVTPKNVPVASVQEALEVFKSGEFGDSVVVKAQALTGGRGKGFFKEIGPEGKGGVSLCKSAEEVEEAASRMIGNTLVTKQTGEEGKPVNSVLLMETLDMESETYFSIIMDRASGGPCLVGSSEGGMNIEEVAETNPEKIVKLPVDIMQGLDMVKLRDMALKMGFPEGKAADQAVDTMEKLYKMFLATDATQVEINPLMLTKSGDVFVSDSKLNFDDNAEFRHADLHKLRDLSQEDQREVEAAKFDLNYIGLDGSIGCLVNGAGLAMATMDLIVLKNGSPANFLDVGGGATESQVEKAFGILDNDPKVKVVLVNIMGGIMQCQVIAQGLVNAAKTLNMTKPIVVRLQGTNVEQGKEIIRNSGLTNMIENDDLDEAAATAVKLAN